MRAEVSRSGGDVGQCSGSGPAAPPPADYVSNAID